MYICMYLYTYLKQIDGLQVSAAELQLCLKLIHIFPELSCSEVEAQAPERKCVTTGFIIWSALLM